MYNFNFLVLDSEEKVYAYQMVRNDSTQKKLDAFFPQGATAAINTTVTAQKESSSTGKNVTFNRQHYELNVSFYDPRVILRR